MNLLEKDAVDQLCREKAHTVLVGLKNTHQRGGERGRKKKTRQLKKWEGDQRFKRKKIVNMHYVLQFDNGNTKNKKGHKKYSDG